MKNMCRDIMIANPRTLHPEQTLHEALHLIRNSGVRYLPIVADNGDFLGMFSLVHLLEALLPRSISINIGSKMTDLNFMKTDIDELQECLDRIGHESVSAYMLTDDIPICHPNDSIIKAIFILHQRHTHVVVTEPNSKHFIGIISINALLDHLQPQPTH